MVATGSPPRPAAVETAIELTGYHANHHARSLATGRANSLAFLLTEPQHLLFADPTFSILLRGAAESLARRHMTLVLLVAGTEAERENVTQFVSGGHVDGVMLVSSHESEPLLDTLIAAAVPTVACGGVLGRTDDVPSVQVDEIESAKVMTRHLKDRGYTRIAMITGPPDTPGGRYRLVGFQEELGDLFDPALVEPGDYTTESGSAAMQKLLDRAPDIDAVFAASDLMASGAMQTLRRNGKRVPADVAVAGFDDSGLAATLEPPLTTMRQPFDKVSDSMVELLLHVIEGKEPPSIVLPTALVVREST